MKYYLHDSNSFNDEKITELFISFGYEGLGLFYTILEKLAQQEKPIKTNVLKTQLKVGKKLQKCWEFMESIELISSNNGETFNNNLLNFSGKYSIKKEKTRERVSQWRKNQELKKNVTCYESVCNTDKVNKSKVKESKLIDLSFLQKDFIPIVEKWLLYKKEKKQEYKGQTSINTFCKKLIEYSNGDAIIAEAIIEQSIANNWAGIFELKNNNNGNKQQNGLDADAQWRAEMQASIARDYAALHE